MKHHTTDPGERAYSIAYREAEEIWQKPENEKMWEEIFSPILEKVEAKVQVLA